MRLLGCVAVLSCNHLADTLQYYQQAFGFIIVNKRETETGLEWVYLKSGDTLLMLERSQTGSEIKETFGRMVFYTDDAPGLHHFIQARGYQVGELRKTEYSMQEFDTVDPEGHRLTIGQQISEN